jgi:hypothetical protein
VASDSRLYDDARGVVKKKPRKTADGATRRRRLARIVDTVAPGSRVPPISGLARAALLGIGW